jgi:hypothetical protein
LKRKDTEMDYELTWRNKWLTSDASSIDDMIQSLQDAADELRAMKARGVVFQVWEPEGECDEEGPDGGEE